MQRGHERGSPSPVPSHRVGARRERRLLGGCAAALPARFGLLSAASALALLVFIGRLLPSRLGCCRLGRPCCRLKRPCGTGVVVLRLARHLRRCRLGRCRLGHWHLLGLGRPPARPNENQRVWRRASEERLQRCAAGPKRPQLGSEAQRARRALAGGRLEPWAASPAAARTTRMAMLGHDSSTDLAAGCSAGAACGVALPCHARRVQC